SCKAATRGASTAIPGETGVAAVTGGSASPQAVNSTATPYRSAIAGSLMMFISNPPGSSAATGAVRHFSLHWKLLVREIAYPAPIMAAASRRRTELIARVSGHHQAAHIHTATHDATVDPMQIISGIDGAQNTQQGQEVVPSWMRQS